MKLLAADDPEVRAAAVFALGALIQAAEVATTSEPSPGEAEAQAALLPEQERLVLERVIVAGLLEVVYDGSPLVRAEVARALARVALGHSVLFQDAVHAHQKTSARILRAKPSSSQNPKSTQVDVAQTAGTTTSGASTASSSGEATWGAQQSSQEARSQSDSAGKWELSVFRAKFSQMIRAFILLNLS